MGKQFIAEKEKSQHASKSLSIQALPIEKRSHKQLDPSLKAYWAAVQHDFKQTHVKALNDFYNLAHSLFGLLKYGTIPATLQTQLLVYLSQLIGTMAAQYGKSKQENALHEQKVTLAFAQEVQEAISKTSLYYYSPEECETGHAIHDDKSNYEIGKRIAVINTALRALPSTCVTRLEVMAEQNLDCLYGLHTPAYLETLNATSTSRHAFSIYKNKKTYPNVHMEDIPFKSNTLDAIKGALGAASAATERTLKNINRTNNKNEGERLFCVVRPPSHHAHHDHAEGFCYASTMMYAAKEIMHEGLQVLIVDFDAHHGNGTYDQLKKLEKDRFYSGKYHFIDVYAEESYIANVPSQGDSSEHMSFYPLSKNEFTGPNVLKSIQAGIARASSNGFIPDAIVVSAGFDAVREDEYGGTLTPEDFSPIGAELAKCCSHMISFLEGGYHLTVLPQAVKHYMFGTIGLAGQPAPHHVNDGLTFVYHALKDAINPGNDTTERAKNNI